MQSTRTDAVTAAPAGARAEAAATVGHWLPVVWGVVVVLCLVFWVAVIALLVTIS